MAEAFDPYRKWLGIPQDEQPPHHYRLLGIALYEDDPDVIENAADRQMAHVRTYQNGKHAALSQKILNELAGAKLTLLQDEKKTAYDEQLREAESPEPPPPEDAAPPQDETAEAEQDDALASLSGVGRPPIRGRGVATAGPQPKVSVVKAPAPVSRKPAAVAAAPAASSSSRGSVLRNRRKKSSPLLFILSGVGLLFAVGLVVLVLALQGGPETDQVTESDPPSQPNNGGTGLRPFDVPEDSGSSGQGGSNNGGSSDFPEIGSESPDDPVGPRQPTFAERVATVRESIAARDKDKTQEALREVRRVARSRDQRAQVAHLEALASYVEQFWQDVFRGAMKLHRLDEDDEDRTFELENLEHEFVELNRGRVTLRIDGKQETWRLRELPVYKALYLAGQGQRDKHASQVFQAAFLLLDAPREDDLPLRIRQLMAHQLYEQAAATQGTNEFLDRELEVAGLDPIASVPADDRTPPPRDDDDEPGEEETAGDDDPGMEEETDPSENPEDNEPEQPGDDDPEIAGDPEDPPGEDDPGEEEIVDDDPRLDIPPAHEIAAAQNQLEQELRGDLSSASTPEAKAQLVGTLLLSASNEKENQALRYAYLERARDIAVRMGNSELTLKTIAEIGDAYRLDVLAEQIDKMRQCGLNVDSSDSYGNFVEESCNLCLAAIEAERPELIGDITQNLARAAARAGAPPRRAVMTGRWFEQYIAILEQLEEAQATLEEESEDPDPAASQIVGTYLCFFEENWKEGLPLLVDAENQALRELAKDSVDPPNAPKDRVALADRWVQLAPAGEHNSAAAHAMIRYALTHYRAVVRRIDRRERPETEAKIRHLQGILDAEAAYMPRS